jgi:pyruvate dehydrogenase E1 component
MTLDYDVIRRIARRAFVQTMAMIHEANARADVAEGDPKVGGHPAACASCLDLLAALHLVVREPADYVCCKPHAAPADHALHRLLGLMRHPDGTWFSDAECQVVMSRLREFPYDGKAVFQSYHSEFDSDAFHFLPSGSVGIPPVISVYLALAHRYAKSHGWDLPQPHFWSMMGDSEFREGSLMEVLPEVAERELGNVTWIVDYNRQNLDGTRLPNMRGLKGTDADRIQRTAEANGWRVLQVEHGALRQQVFARPGGAALRDVLERGFSDYAFQMLLWKQDPGAIRDAITERSKECAGILGQLDDGALWRVFSDLGGHDLHELVAALRASKEQKEGLPAQPCLLVVHTLKGRGLQCAAAPGNHSAMTSDEEIARLLAGEGLSKAQPYAGFAPSSKEGRYLAARGAALRTGIEAWERMRDQNRALVDQQLEASGPIPDSLEVNIKLAPWANTQWMWGQLAAKLVRVGVWDELTKAGKPAGKAPAGDEKKWSAVADLILTMAPDVGTSTNINPAMDEKIYGPEYEENLGKKYDLHERLRPELHPTDEAWTRHIRFEIAEANCMSAAGSFGKMGYYTGIPFLPMMTVYDFFIKRALDQLYYDLYWASGFVLVGTPSGVTLAPEGAQHSWKSDIQIPNLITWEPAFAQELDWILCDAMRRHVHGDNEHRRGVLIRAVTRGVKQDLFLKNLRRQVRCKKDLPSGAMLGMSAADGGLPESEVPALADAEILALVRQDVLRGGYYLRDHRGYRGYSPGENVVHLFVMGALVMEALAAADLLLERGVYADVVVVTSPDLLLGLNGRRDGYQHLLVGLGIDGRLWLRPDGQALSALDAVDLAGRRIPIVSVHDGEEGLLDNIGSLVGVKQTSLCVRKFSKSGTPAHVYGYHGLDPASIAEACWTALTEMATEKVSLDAQGHATLERFAAQGRAPAARVIPKTVHAK